MFYLNVWLTVQDEAEVENVRGYLAQCTRLSREEPGCVRYEVYHSQAERKRFLLCEHWATREDWERHRTARAFQEVYHPLVIPRVVREPHISDLIEPK